MLNRAMVHLHHRAPPALTTPVSPPHFARVPRRGAKGSGCVKMKMKKRKKKKKKKKMKMKMKMKNNAARAAKSSRRISR